MGRASRSSRWGLVHFLCRWARRWTGVGADACWWRVVALLVVCKAGQLFRASMSPRTFARRFRQRTGTTPGSWVNQQRVLLAARLLERGNDTIAAVSVHSGFGSPDTLRRHFIQARGITPSQHRRAFRLTEPGTSTDAGTTSSRWPGPCPAAQAGRRSHGRAPAALSRVGRPDRAGNSITTRERKRIICRTTAGDRETPEAAQADAQVPAQQLSRSLPPSTGR